MDWAVSRYLSSVPRDRLAATQIRRRTYVRRKMSSPRSIGRRCSGLTGILVLLIVVCLVECATEQRINSRGSKSAIEKVNGWRSQRGGSCLSYGHSCWGAHGKRSGKAHSSAPDWYLTRILRRMAANSELNRVRQGAAANDEATDILRLAVAGEVTPDNGLVFINDDLPLEIRSRVPEAKPMLDDNTLTNIKIWQIMRQAAEEK